MPRRFGQWLLGVPWGHSERAPHEGGSDDGRQIDQENDATTTRRNHDVRLFLCAPRRFGECVLWLDREECLEEFREVGAERRSGSGRQIDQQNDVATTRRKHDLQLFLCASRRFGECVLCLGSEECRGGE